MVQQSGDARLLRAQSAAARRRAETEVRRAVAAARRAACKHILISQNSSIIKTLSIPDTACGRKDTISLRHDFQCRYAAPLHRDHNQFLIYDAVKIGIREEM